MKRTWTTEQLQYLRDNYLYMTHKEMAAGLGKTDTAVKSKCGVMRLLKPADVRNELLRKHGFEANRHKMLTPEEDAFVMQNYLSIPIKSLAKMLGKGQTAVRGSIKRQGIIIPPELAEYRKAINQKRKGNIAFNKGLPQKSYMTPESIEKTIASRFLKGHMPHNTKQDDAITRRGDGYLYKRIALGIWKPLHHLIWEAANGKIPKGYCLTMKDGNKDNHTLENMEIITRKENARRNAIYENAQNLTDDYVASVLARRTDLDKKDIPQPLIDMKRAALKINRELNKISQNESESKKAGGS